jgi:transposase
MNRNVAMESTGVYWIAPHEVLEAQGLQLLLVDTGQLAQVPGRDKKSDPTHARHTSNTRRAFTRGGRAGLKAWLV